MNDIYVFAPLIQPQVSDVFAVRRYPEVIFLRFRKKIFHRYPAPLVVITPRQAHDHRRQYQKYNTAYHIIKMSLSFHPKVEIFTGNAGYATLILHAVIYE